MSTHMPQTAAAGKYEGSVLQSCQTGYLRMHHHGQEPKHRGEITICEPSAYREGCK